MHQIPSSLPPLFSGDRLVVYGVLKASGNANEGDDNEVRLEGMLGNDEKVQHLVKFSTPPIAVENKETVLLHQLAAKSFIQEKQDGDREMNDVQEPEEAKRSTISISKSANVVSKFTSFVAVDKDSNQPVSGSLQKHFVSSYQIADLLVMPNWMSFLSSPQPLGASYASFDDDQSSDPVVACAFLAREKCSLGFSSLKSMPKSSATKKKSKGLFSWLCGSLARPSAPAAEEGVLACIYAPRLDGMSRQTKEAPAAWSVISLQKASGSWDLTDQLVSLCGTSRAALIKGCPIEIAVDSDEGKLLWATALALVLLMGKFLDQKDEWGMIAEKGTKWMKKNLPAVVKYENVLAAAATTVGVQIKLGQ